MFRLYNGIRSFHSGTWKDVVYTFGTMNRITSLRKLTYTPTFFGGRVIYFEKSFNKIHTTQVARMTPLHRAAQGQHDQVYSFLLDRGLPAVGNGPARRRFHRGWLFFLCFGKSWAWKTSWKKKQTSWKICKQLETSPNPMNIYLEPSRLWIYIYNIYIFIY